MQLKKREELDGSSYSNTVPFEERRWRHTSVSSWVHQLPGVSSRLPDVKQASLKPQLGLQHTTSMRVTVYK